MPCENTPLYLNWRVWQGSKADYRLARLQTVLNFGYSGV